MEEGSEVILAVEGDSLRITTRRAAIRRARENLRRYVPADVSLVGELSADRRKEAELEAEREAKLEERLEARDELASEAEADVGSDAGADAEANTEANAGDGLG